jgi:hypothetical protein
MCIAMTLAGLDPVDEYGHLSDLENRFAVECVGGIDRSADQDGYGSQV